MKKVKLDLSWRVWSLIIGAFILIGFLGVSYAYGSSSPSIMGHSAGELNISLDCIQVHRYNFDAAYTTAGEEYKSAFENYLDGLNTGITCINGYTLTGCFLGIGGGSYYSDIWGSKENTCSTDDEERAGGAYLTAICCKLK